MRLLGQNQFRMWPFPRVNETAAVQEKIILYITKSYRRSAVTFAKRAVPVVVVVVAAVVWWARQSVCQ